jgi:hypothetical protein
VWGSLRISWDSQVFGGQWMLPWKHFARVAAAYFNIHTQDELLQFTK